jgi:hypothetical protein
MYVTELECITDSEMNPPSFLTEKSYTELAAWRACLGGGNN